MVIKKDIPNHGDTILALVEVGIRSAANEPLIEYNSGTMKNILAKAKKAAASKSRIPSYLKPWDWLYQKKQNKILLVFCILLYWSLVLGRFRNIQPRLKKDWKLFLRPPNIGHKRRDLPGKLLVYPVGQHLIIYTIEMKERIAVLRVLHSRMDFSDRIWLRLNWSSRALEFIRGRIRELGFKRMLNKKNTLDDGKTILKDVILSKTKVS